MKRSAETERLLGDLIDASSECVKAMLQAKLHAGELPVTPTYELWSAGDKEYKALMALRNAIRHDCRNALSVDEVEAEILAGMAAEVKTA